MKLLFVYTPFSSTVHPPVGLAYLKGFIKANLPNINISCFDLNLDSSASQIKRKVTVSSEKLFFSSSNCSKLLAYRMLTKEKNIKENWLDEYNLMLLEYLKNCSNEGKVATLLGNDIRKINNFNPQIIGFSVLYKSQLIYSLALAKILKKSRKFVAVFGGGLFSTSSLLDGDKLVSPGMPVDFIVRGGGEIPMLKILVNYKNGVIKNISNIPSVTYFDIRRQKIIRNPTASHELSDKYGIVKYSTLPDYSDFKLKQYNEFKFFSLKISGGCSWGKCKFCSSSSQRPIIYCKNIKSIIKEILQLKKEFNVTCFEFIAPEVPKFFIDNIASALVENKININYSIYLRPLASVDNGFLKKLYYSGCRLINYGVESFSQRILDLMDKGTRVNDIIDLLKRTKKAKISTACWYMVGFPSHTRNEIRKEIVLLRKNFKYMDFLSCSQFKLKKESLIYKNKELLIPKKIKKNIFDDEDMDFEVKSGLSRQEAKRYADIISNMYVYDKKIRKFKL